MTDFLSEFHILFLFLTIYRVSECRLSAFGCCFYKAHLNVNSQAGKSWYSYARSDYDISGQLRYHGAA